MQTFFDNILLFEIIECYYCMYVLLIAFSSEYWKIIYFHAHVVYCIYASAQPHIRRNTHSHMHLCSFAAQQQRQPKLIIDSTYRLLLRIFMRVCIFDGCMPFHSAELNRLLLYLAMTQSSDNGFKSNLPCCGKWTEELKIASFIFFLITYLRLM